jgi:hypothetical protein
MPDPTPVLVIYRRWKSDPRSIIAIFPELPGTNDHHTCMTYETVGQHGHGHFRSMIRRTVPTTPREYAALRGELERIGYRPYPIHRATREHHKARYQATLRPAATCSACGRPGHGADDGSC